MQLPGGRARVQIQSVGVPSSGSQQAAKLLIPKVAARLEGGDLLFPASVPVGRPAAGPAACALCLQDRSEVTPPLHPRLQHVFQELFCRRLNAHRWHLFFRVHAL